MPAHCKRQEMYTSRQNTVVISEYEIIKATAERHRIYNGSVRACSEQYSFCSRKCWRFLLTIVLDCNYETTARKRPIYTHSSTIQVTKAIREEAVGFAHGGRGIPSRYPKSKHAHIYPIHSSGYLAVHSPYFPPEDKQRT